MPVDERVARSVALEQAYVHDVYEQFYDNPKSKPWPKVQRFLDELEPGSLVCDVGCGNGKYLNVNTSIFNIGGEKSTRLSEVAREKENEVVTLDNLALPFRDESLDAVVSIAVVHHLATTDRRICALRELARVLRIGGRLIISVWAMEQSHRKFESQDVLVPWHRPRHLSTRPSLELTSTTTNTSEDDGTLPPYHAYTQTSDSDSNRSIRSKGLGKKKGRNRHKGKSIDPRRSSSPSSSSLSSPNETCYSFVRRAIQKLAGGGRRVGVHRPWFLDSWSTCAKEPPPPQKRYDPDGCECCDCCSSIEENVQDLPIELRRIDDEDLPQRRQTFPSSQLINDISNNLKSKSMTNIKTVENNNNIENNKASVDSNEHVEVIEESKSDDVPSAKNTLIRPKPKLVKQKKSICDNAEEEEAEEALDQPTDMTERNLPEFKILHNRYHHRGGVLKQRSLNEELMSTDRLKEKERVRQNIQKQASLNEDLFYQSRHHAAFDTFKDSFFSVSTSKRFQLIKTGFTNKIKNSTTNIEKVTGTSLKNAGFVRMFQNWKSSDLISPSIPEDETMENMKKIVVSASTMEEKKDGTTAERRHSKEDGSDSSKDSSLQSDTSVDSEDSFASVIFVPKSDPMSPTSNLSPGPTSPRLKNSSVPNSPRIKQSSCPTSPRIKQMPLTLYPLTKQLSSPKPSTDESAADKSSDRDHMDNSTINKDINTTIKTLAQKYSVQQIPQFRRTSLNSPPPGNNTTTTTTTTTITTMTTTTTTNNNNAIVSNVVSPEKSPVESRNERLKKIKELLSQKPGFGVRNSKSNFPIVRQSSVTNGGKVEAIAKPLPKLLTLELFNPETDDKDSDSSCVSSPDSIDSVININNEPCCKTKFKFPPTNNHRRPSSENNKSMSLLEAAADVANSLDEAVEHVIKSTSPRRRAKRKLQTGEVLSVIQRYYSDTQPLLNDDDAAAAVHSCWNEECHRYLTDFADKLSEKLLQEIDNYQEKSKGRALMSNSLDDYDDDNNSSSIDDPYIHRLSEELNDLSKLSAEIQKQNEYLAKLSASDNLYIKMCSKCKMNECKCYRTKSKINISPNNNNNRKVIGDDGAETTNINPNSKLNSSNNKSAITNDLFSNNLDSEQCDIKCLDNNIDDNNIDMIGSVTKTAKMIRLGTSTDSYDSEKESSTNSILSSVATSINFGQSMESTDGNSESQKDTNSISRYSDGGGSTASLVSSSNCPPEWKTPKTKSDSHQQLTKDASCLSLESTYSSSTTTNNKRLRERSLISETSQDSLPSDNIGGEITYHRYYHVFREGELDQLIEKYVENLHIISSYYDHASWCIIAEKVQVWTI